jgi:hypothetical protein
VTGATGNPDSHPTLWPGSHAVRARCPAHPAAPLRRFGDRARCPECGNAVELCDDRFSHKECGLARDHDGMHCSESGSCWPDQGADHG